MLIKTNKGLYQVVKNFKDAYDQVKFEDTYLEECFDQYPYLVGDVSSGILRLKGFNTDPKSNKYFGFIDEYIEDSCPFQCPFFVLKRIKNEAEYEKLLADDPAVIEVLPYVVKSKGKIPYDKENLVLESNPKVTPHIVIDSNKINKMPRSNIAPDAVKETEEDKVEDVVYSSSSPNFVPSDNSRKFNNNKNNRNNRQNYNNNNRNNNNNNNQNKENNQNNNQNNNNNNNSDNQKKNNYKKHYYNNNKGNNNKPKNQQ